MFEITNNNIKIKTADKMTQSERRLVIDNGKLLESTGECFYGCPNATCAQDDFLSSRVVHKLILSRIIPTRV